MKNFSMSLLAVIIGVGIGFAAGKSYLYFTKPCGCTEKQKQIEEWTKTPEFLKH